METLINQLKSIRLSGMAQKLAIRLQEISANELPYLDFIKNLVDNELSICKVILQQKLGQKVKLV